MLKNRLAKYQPLIDKIKLDNSSITFLEGKRFSWNPKTNTITTTNNEPTIETVWSLLHEIAHAKLGHSHFHDDYQLLLFEVEAWREAKVLADYYEVQIDSNYSEDCIDSYRDWLYLRSKCPRCNQSGIQTDAIIYQCINCSSEWKVSPSQACSVKRIHIKK